MPHSVCLIRDHCCDVSRRSQQKERPNAVTSHAPSFGRGITLILLFTWMFQIVCSRNSLHCTDAFVANNRRNVEVNPNGRTFQTASGNSSWEIVNYVDSDKDFSYANEILFGVRLQAKGVPAVQIGFCVADEEKRKRSLVLFDMWLLCCSLICRKRNEFVLLKRRVPIHPLYYTLSILVFLVSL